MIRSNHRADSVGEVLSAGIETAEDDLLVVNPSGDAIEGLVGLLKDATDPPPVRLFAAENLLKDLMEDFLVASTVADLVEQETLSVRTLASVPNNALVVSPESVVALVEGADSAAGLATTDEAFVGETYDYYDGRWHGADQFSLRTPPRSAVRETLADDLGTDVASDFTAMLDTLETARGDGDGLDEVTISLLVAARNGELLYDISKWGEDVGLASKATFSRTKTRLEEADVIDTEKVPIDVGRPRLRLLPGDEQLAEAPIPELAGEVQHRLA